MSIWDVMNGMKVIAVLKLLIIYEQRNENVKNPFETM